MTVLAPDQLQAIVLLFLNAHDSVVLIWGLFFALHLFVFGYLVYNTIGFLSSIEIAFPLWLLIKGVNVEQWEKGVLETA